VGVGLVAVSVLAGVLLGADQVLELVVEDEGLEGGPAERVVVAGESRGLGLGDLPALEGLGLRELFHDVV